MLHNFLITMVPTIPIYGLILLPSTLGVEFNHGLATSVLGRVSKLTALPWSVVLNPVRSSFSSTFSALNLDETRQLLWPLFKAFRDDADSIPIDMIYCGFPNGGFTGYTLATDANEPGVLVEMQNRSSSCPDYTSKCRRSYDGTTDVVSGQATGPPSSTKQYDPTQRPWYQHSLVRSTW